MMGLTWLNCMFAPAQIITLNEIQKKAEANYPAMARYDIIEKTKDFSIANANRGFCRKAHSVHSLPGSPM